VRDNSACCEPELLYLVPEWIARKCTIDQAPYAKRIFIFQFIRQCGLAKIIVASFKL